MYRTRQNKTHVQESWNFLCLHQASPDHSLSLIQVVTSSLAQHLHPSSIIASCLPSSLPPTPFSIVCAAILLSLPGCPALHREEVALPLPSLLVRTIQALSLSLSLSVTLSCKARIHEALRTADFLTQSLTLRSLWKNLDLVLTLARTQEMQS